MSPTVLVPIAQAPSSLPVHPRLLELKRMVLDSVVSTNSKRNYAQALDGLFLFSRGRPLTRALLMEWRATMENQAPSTVNVRLSAVRKMVSEARRNGMLGAEEAANLTDIPNIRQQGTRLGNWLTKEQARELLMVPARNTLKGKRDYAILALLVGCGLRRRELAGLDVEDIQLRENRWVIADLRGKGGRIRTVAVPVWVKNGINVWLTAARIEEGRLFRSVRRAARRSGRASATGQSGPSSSRRPKRSASSASARMTCAGPAPSCAARQAEISNRSSSSWGTLRSRPPSVISARSRTSPSRLTTHSDL